MLLDRLRHESRPHHLSLEEVVGLPATLEQHQSQLRGFYGFIEPWERKLRASTHAYLLADREKAPLLAEDLRYFGLDDVDLAALPRCPETPSVASLPSVLGTLYVFEGATLGGQLIARHVETKLHLAEGHGYRYFRGHGADTPRRWHDFRQLLLDHSAPHVDDLIVAAAQATFTQLHRWFAPVSLAA